MAAAKGATQQHPPSKAGKPPDVGRGNEWDAATTPPVGRHTESSPVSQSCAGSWGGGARAGYAGVAVPAPGSGADQQLISRTAAVSNVTVRTERGGVVYCFELSWDLASLQSLVSGLGDVSVVQKQRCLRATVRSQGVYLHRGLSAVFVGQQPGSGGGGALEPEVYFQGWQARAGFCLVFQRHPQTDAAAAAEEVGALSTWVRLVAVRKAKTRVPEEESRPVGSGRVSLLCAEESGEGPLPG